MKCTQCGSEWSVPDNVKISISKCPFCNANIYEKESKTIADVLIEWGKRDGIDFFKIQ